MCTRTWIRFVVFFSSSFFFFFLAHIFRFIGGFPNFICTVSCAALLTTPFFNIYLEFVKMVYMYLKHICADALLLSVI